MYLLLFLHYKDQFFDIFKIDNIISTELPDPENNLQLFCIISSVIYGLCKKLNINALYINKSKMAHYNILINFFESFYLKL